MDKFLLGVLTGVAGIAVAAVISDRLDCSHQNISFNDEETESDAEEESKDSTTEGSKKSEGEDKRNSSILGEGLGFLFKGVN